MLSKRFDAEWDGLKNHFNKLLGSKIPSCFHEILKNTFKELDEKITESAKENSKNINRDPIADFIDNIYDNKTGIEFTKEESASIYKKYQDNVQAKADCPGSKDKEKKTNPAGDFFVWNKILNKAEIYKKDIIFVTSDSKEDWWLKDKGGNYIGPRSELIKEFNEKTNGKVFYMYNLNDFIEYSSNYTDHPIKEEVKNEIEELNRDSWLGSESIRKLAEALNSKSYMSSILNFSKMLEKNSNLFMPALQQSRLLDIFRDSNISKIMKLNAIFSQNGLSEMVKNYNILLNNREVI